jgi:hypothetical protein
MKNRSTPSIATSRSGQSLVEALVALSILTVGFLGIITLLNKSLQLSKTTSDDTQATYLAAEGIEVAKSLIDHDVYEGIFQGSDEWGACFPLPGVHYYELDYATTNCASLISSANPMNSPLYFHPATDLFSYSSAGGTKSAFTRDIKITNNGEEIDVQSIVHWSDGLASNDIVLEDQFYNWHPLSN